ncbi:hypothetical protein V6N13_145122 [Hibiscus sabdariffa]
MQRDNVIKCCRPHSSLSQPVPQILLLLLGSCPVEGLGFLLLSLHFLRLSVKPVTSPHLNAYYSLFSPSVSPETFQPHTNKTGFYSDPIHNRFNSF